MDANANAKNSMLIVRDREHVRQAGPVDDWRAYTLIGGLSANPTTFAELMRAWLRYEAEPEGGLSWRLRPAEAGSEADSEGGHWLLIDLARQCVLAGADFELPEDGAAYECCPDEGAGDAVAGGAGQRKLPLVWINNPPGWEMGQASRWQDAIAAPLPKQAAPLDVRAVLYGPPLAEGLARQVLARAAKEESTPDRFVSANRSDWTRVRTEEEKKLGLWWHGLTVDVHADWLMTPRDDLNGEPPRAFLHRGREWVERELENRTRQWDRQNAAPPLLDKNTYAYRYGPFGRQEVVIYFDLCRKLIPEAWRRVVDAPDIGEDELALILRARAEQWLSEKGAIEGLPWPPATLIERERRLGPLAEEEPCETFDSDCPLCQMGGGTAFLGFDGHHLELDDEFAFSLYESRREWEFERGCWAYDDSPDNDRESRASFRMETAESVDTRPSEESPSEESPSEESPSEESPSDESPSDEPESPASAGDPDRNGTPVEESGPDGSDEASGEEAQGHNQDDCDATWKNAFVADWARVSALSLATRLTELVCGLRLRDADPGQIQSLNSAFEAYQSDADNPTLRGSATKRLSEMLEQVAREHLELTPRIADLQSHLEAHQRQLSVGSTNNAR